MAANSDANVPSQKAVKTALAGKAASDVGLTRPFIVATGEWWLSTQGLATGYSPSTPSSNTANSNNYVRYTPIYLSETTTIDGMALFMPIGNAGAGAVIALALFDVDPATGRPKNVVIDAGTQSINTTGMKTMTFTAVSVPAGYYWVGASTRGLDTGGTNPAWAIGTGGAAVGETTPAASNNMTPYLGGTSATWPVADPPATIARTISPGYPHVWLRRG